MSLLDGLRSIHTRSSVTNYPCNPRASFPFNTILSNARGELGNDYSTYNMTELILWKMYCVTNRLYSP